MQDDTHTDGLVRVRSALPVSATAERLEQMVAETGFTVVAHIDHAVSATSVGLTFLPMVLLLSANQKSGTSLIQLDQTARIELPLRPLAW
jgi:uncharacterized protein (DUF302 family)